MNKAEWVGLALAALMGVAGAAANVSEPSLCTRLADAARKAPAQTWAARDPLAAWVKTAGNAPSSPVATALLADARLQKELGADPRWSVLHVHKLDAAPVYLLETFGGTAYCQSLVLIEARPGGAQRQLSLPFALREGELCMTQRASLARVLGQPALIVGGAPGMASPDLSYRIVEWTGKDWGRACNLAIRRRTAVVPAQRFCPPDARACEAGQSVAQRLAEAYERVRESEALIDGEAFNGGLQPDAAVVDALSSPQVRPGAMDFRDPPFPTFGVEPNGLDPMRTLFSHGDWPRRLAVLVDGRWWLAAVGRAGVGWRVSDTVLVALFSPPGREEDGVASYQFVVKPVGLLDVSAAPVRR